MQLGGGMINQSLADHLLDLKKLVIQFVVTYVIGVLIAVVYQNKIYTLILGPIRGLEVVNDGQKQELILTFLSVSSPLTFQFNMILFSGFVITSPVLLYFLWQYVKPALHPTEQKFANVFILSSSVLSLVGTLYAYSLILPYSLRFFTSLNQNIALLNTQFSIDANAYFEFFQTLFIATLVTFQVPIIIFGLVRFGIITREFLKENKKLLYFAMMIGLFALIPGDISISLMVVTPMILLLEVAIYLGSLGQKKKTS